MFMVVSSETQCKDDFCVASISAFVAPRGSTSRYGMNVKIRRKGKGKWDGEEEGGRFTVQSSVSSWEIIAFTTQS